MSDTDRWSDRSLPRPDDPFAVEPSDPPGGERTADEWLPQPSLGDAEAQAPFEGATGDEAGTGDGASPDGPADAEAASTWATESPAWGSGTPQREIAADPVVPEPTDSTPGSPVWRSGVPAMDLGTSHVAEHPVEATPEERSPETSPPDAPAFGAPTADEPTSPAASWGPDEPRQWGESADDEPAPAATAKDWSPAIPPGWPGDPPPGSWTPEPGTFQSTGEDDRGRWSGGSWAESSAETEAGVGPVTGGETEGEAAGTEPLEAVAAWPAADRADEPGTEPGQTEPSDGAKDHEPDDAFARAKAQIADGGPSSELAADVASAAPTDDAEEIESTAEAAPDDDDATGGSPADDATGPPAFAASAADGGDDRTRVEPSGPSPADVQVSQRGYDLIQADRVQLSQGGANRIEGREVYITQGGAGRVSADQVSISMGGIGMARARQVTLEADSTAFLVVADEARVQNGGRVLVLLSRSVTGDARAVLDWRSVAAVVAVLSVFRLLTRRMRGR